MMKYFTLILLFISLPALAAEEICSSPSNEKNIPASTPTSQFDFTEDGGTVTDKKTGLMWARCPLGYSWGSGGCVSGSGGMSWETALEFVSVNSLEIDADELYLGYADWRLPNIKELASIIERKCASRAINQQVFGSLAIGPYWSNTHSAADDRLILGVNFSQRNDIVGGIIRDVVTQEFFVRLVRSPLSPGE